MLVDFWTYSCVNCIRTLPYLKAWYSRYHAAGLEIVGVHTPEFAFEHVVGNVRRAVSEHDIRYPVAVDDGYKTWNAWANQYWPADYLIDRTGHVRDAHFGEGAYGETESKIRTLLGEAAPAAHAAPHGAIGVSGDVQTPETYLGTFRANYSQAIHGGEVVQLHAGGHLVRQRRPAGRALARREPEDRRRRGGAPPLQATSRRASTSWRRLRREPRARSRRTIDGTDRPLIRVPHDDLYQLAHLANPGPHTLDLSVRPGTSLYSFTFG